MGYLKILSRVTAGVKETQTNRTQLTPLLITCRASYYSQLAASTISSGRQFITQPKPHVQTVTITLSSKSISAFSQNEISPEHCPFLCLPALPLHGTPWFFPSPL